ncbi:MAG: hypothetical protein HY520_00570 [Candidatus Aenigmarchaeota archaeon]|nr:hypothetical protein [Candidatus Aenigmarchaeota archaeon]
MDWEQDVRTVAKQLCGRTFCHYTGEGALYQGLITETCGYSALEGRRENLFHEAPGTIVLWPYRGRMITNIAAHEYEGSGLVEIRRVMQGDELLGPLAFTAAFQLEGLDGVRIRKTGGGVYVAETPGLREQGWRVADVLKKESHPHHRVAHWLLEC